MPCYSYKCHNCGAIHEKINKISECESNAPYCCNSVCSIVILSAPMANTSFLGSAANPGYVSPLSGKWIDSKRARINEMREHDVVEKA